MAGPRKRTGASSAMNRSYRQNRRERKRVGRIKAAGTPRRRRGARASTTMSAIRHTMYANGEAQPGASDAPDERNARGRTQGPPGAPLTETVSVSCKRSDFDESTGRGKGSLQARVTGTPSCAPTKSLCFAAALRALRATTDTTSA
jgi:hypothetical protein